MTAPVIPGAGYARVSWGRWVVDCGNPYCTGALTLGPDLVGDDKMIRRGLAWGQTGMQCWDCGFVSSPIVWPTDPDAIEMLLVRRPDIRTRNWFPNERLEDLLAENISHELLPPELDLNGPSVGIMITANERIVGGLLLDALPDAEVRRAITPGEN